MIWLKPLDKELLVRLAEAGIETVVTVEDGAASGGLDLPLANGQPDMTAASGLCVSGHRTNGWHKVLLMSFGMSAVMTQME